MLLAVWFFERPPKSCRRGNIRALHRIRKVGLGFQVGIRTRWSTSQRNFGYLFLPLTTAIAFGLGIAGPKVVGETGC
jgi:hypothetical protein